LAFKFNLRRYIEEGTSRLLYELKTGQVSSSPPRAIPTSSVKATKAITVKAAAPKVWRCRLKPVEARVESAWLQ
jgi:hypothetical protein